MRFLLLYIVVFLSISVGCSTVSEQVVIESNSLKNLASDNTRVANDFLKRYEYNKALIYYREALKYNIMSDNIPGIIKNYADIGKVHVLMKQYDEALDYYQKALDRINQEGEGSYRGEEAYIMNGLGETYYFMRNFEAAERFYQLSLDIERSLMNTENQAIVLQNLAKIKRSNGSYAEALDDFLKSASLLEPLFRKKELEDLKNLSLIYYSIALTYSKLHKYEEGFSFVEKALKIDKIIENSSGIADDYFAMGMLSKRMERLDRALLYFERSRELYYLLNYIDQYIELSGIVAELYLESGRFKEYYESKVIVYKLSTGELKVQTRKELYGILQRPEIMDLLSESQINDIKVKYRP